MSTSAGLPRYAGISHSSGMRTAAIIGTGLIGTSVALALTRRGVAVYLTDRDESTLRTAASLGAGDVSEPPVPVDLAVIAVPPAHVATVLADAQRRGLAAAYTDVASVKADPQNAAAAHGVDQKTYIGGHPLSGRETVRRISAIEQWTVWRSPPLGCA